MFTDQTTFLFVRCSDYISVYSLFFDFISLRSLIRLDFSVFTALNASVCVDCVEPISVCSICCIQLSVFVVMR